MDIETYRTKAQLALESLAGLTPDEIAEYMEVQGIRGECTRVMDCIIANFLTMQTGVESYTNGQAYGAVLRENDKVGLYAAAILPANVVEFTYHFDLQRYPSLITERR